MARDPRRVAAASAVLVLLLASPAFAAESSSGSPWKKLARGLINVVTGWVEIPKRVQETSEVSGPAAGFTWGILRGIGYGFIRTIAGGYETLTFPFPAPPDYEPVIDPAYVF